MTPTIITSLAAVVIASLAWDFGRKWLAYRGAQLINLSRMDALETEFKSHVKTHAAAIKNLVEEMRTTTNEIKTKASTALERANGAKQRRF